MKCPCEECLSLAICYHLEIIECDILYGFLCKTFKDVDGKEYFIKHRLYTRPSVKRTFKKVVSGTTVGNKGVILK